MARDSRFTYPLSWEDYCIVKKEADLEAKLRREKIAKAKRGRPKSNKITIKKDVKREDKLVVKPKGRLSLKQQRELRRKKYLIAYREDTREKAKRYREIRKQELAGVIAGIKAKVKRSCKEAKHPMASCSPEELELFLDTEGILAYYTQWLESGFKKELKPTVFRINPHLGYVTSNMKLDTYENYRKTFGGTK